VQEEVDMTKLPPRRTEEVCMHTLKNVGPLAVQRSWKVGRATTVAACFLVACIASVACAQDDVTLSLAPVSKQNVNVTFLPATGTATERPSDTELRDMIEALTSRRKSKVYADLTHIGPNKYSNLFLYTFFAHDGSQAADRGWYRFDVKSQTSNFVDSRETVHFTLERGRDSDDGEITLPLHSFGDQPLVNIALADNPTRVRLSSENDIQLNVENLSSTLGVSVVDPAQLMLDNQSLWKTAAGPLNITGGKSLMQGSKSTIFVRVVPNKMQALLATLSPFKPDKSHATIKIVLNWVADQGGGLKTTPPIPIPVRFEPSFPSLFLAATIGSVLATVLSQLLPSAWKTWRAFLRQLVVSWGLAIVVEAFAMLLVQLGSKLVLFGFELDPWQVLPTLFIGFFASGGKHLLDYVGATKAAASVGMPAGDAGGAAAGGDHG
jgi:hypothetical protein